MSDDQLVKLRQMDQYITTTVSVPVDAPVFDEDLEAEEKKTEALLIEAGQPRSEALAFGNQPSKPVPVPVTRQELIATQFSRLQLTTLNPRPLGSGAEDSKARKIRMHRYCKPFYSILGWILTLLCGVGLIIISLFIGPPMFCYMKMGYIWNDVLWDTLVSYRLQPENTLYAFKQFPHPNIFKHYGASYRDEDMCVVTLKLLYVIPQSIIFGHYIFLWLMWTVYSGMSKQFVNPTAFHTLLEMTDWMRMTPFGQAVRRTLSGVLFVFDVSTDIVIMINLYGKGEKYWFSLVFGSIFAALLVPWARSITYVKEYFIKKKDNRFVIRLVRTTAILYLIPWFGIVMMSFLDVYLTVQIILDWPRLLFFGEIRNESEEEESYRKLRSLTELIAESIPQLIIQAYILQKYDNPETLGVSEMDLYRSIAASIGNLIFQLVQLKIEADGYQIMFEGANDTEKISLAHYMFISMEGRFGFSTKLLSIQSGAAVVDLSNVEFRSDPFLVSNFIQATMWESSDHRTLQRIIIGPNTIAGVNEKTIRSFGEHCMKQNIRIVINVPFDRWYKCQMAHEFALFVVDDYSSGETALTYAVSKDDYDGLEWAERLLKSGADVNLRNQELDSPVYLAAYHKKPNFVKLFLKYGANVSNPQFFNRENKTPLFPSCDSHIMDNIAILLDHGVDVFARETFQGRTALGYGGWIQFDVCDTILSHETTKKQEQKRKQRLVNVAENNEDTFLFAATNHGNERIVRRTIEAGADLTVRGANGETAVFKARTADVLEILINAGADINTENIKGETPLFRCVQRAHNLDELLPIYTKLGADINHNNRDREHIGFLLARSGNWKCLIKIANEMKLYLGARNIEGATVVDLCRQQSDNEDALAKQYLKPLVDALVSQNKAIHGHSSA